MISTVAPAKINWTLEVLGRRDDGYHEVRTVMQAVDLCDEVSVGLADSLTVARNLNAYAADDEDIVLRAARALAAASGRKAEAAISVTKRVPAAAGLGGGSSDGAATLRALDRLWETEATEDRLHEVAAGLGSDVPFFLTGGTALGEGRGERMTPLADVGPTWLVILVPALTMSEKTKQMYAALRPGDFTRGLQTDDFVAQLSSGRPVAGDSLFNAFERAAYESFDGLASFRDSLVQAGAPSVHVCGAGPALFCVASGESEARAIRSRVARVRRGEKVHVVRTLTGAESTAVWSDGEASG
ncbi:MAG: 4-(cytidine 5'-diphospho)-2-C-methyl-D-erythritol kinase [Chloroflexi bacterium]|nr:4-(cytidine 5'-diphospho)-2-C-methyl-D-erythritol kinase [Chloroflexota bacterium]MCI0782817.1 4-(cytidine 5'-diphospho)-2-C-methyl-D-erythritol kinase [Chloroflexota bacterium]MCI0813460.1 4-(cytidine 5'-diphospho)-2-C-methyl-D-erythritol kinase [Chloroflexota bacterium]MCI0816858.1 4-(cytidine 5'-diphospho)-2-C-methyl-D-erythritol kinase [Chloroflexota bacterium]MCI0818866.1 4-(cytidine 5'-diphospho)-2-C-methyl-D-erythritol kinase [Chloroflexota bacterium]